MASCYTALHKLELINKKPHDVNNKSNWYYAKLPYVIECRVNIYNNGDSCYTILHCITQCNNHSLGVNDRSLPPVFPQFSHCYGGHSP